MKTERAAPSDPVMGPVSRLVPRRVLRLPAIARYGIALAATAVAVLLRVALIPVWGAETRFVTFYAAVALSSWVGGFGPGFVSTVLAALVVNYYWMPPQLTQGLSNPADVATLAGFVAVATLISGLNDVWRRAVTALHRVEEKLRVTFASIGDAVITTDNQGHVSKLNPVAETLTGWTAREAAGRPLEQVLALVNEDSRHPVANPAEKVLREGVVVGLGNHTILLAKDGREIPIDDSAAPIRFDDGTVTGVVIVFRDVTERRNRDRERQQAAALLEEALQAERAARHEAEQATKLKDQFLATVSHELRAPLNAVLGWAEMLRTGALKDTRRQQALESVVVNAKRQAQLIDDLLDVARIVSGKLLIARNAVDLSAVIRGALDVVEPAAEHKRIDVAVHIDDSIGPILGDAARLQQVLWNLLTNAVKFTPEDGSIRIAVTRSDNSIAITVTDTGRGVTPDFLPVVFEPFRQADGSSTGTHGGLGLGLSIVKHLVEAHAGTVSVTSAGHNQGATFTVRLPIVAVYTTNTEQATSPAAAPGVGMGQGGPVPSLEGVTVLVVDDDADSREMVAACLEGCNASVVTAASTSQALTILEGEHVDVLLSDIAMHDEDGYALIRRVRAMESPLQAAIPAAALTSFANEVDRQRTLQAGFQVHLAKPVDTRELIYAVATLALRMASQ